MKLLKLPENEIKYPTPPTKVPVGQRPSTPEQEARIEFFHKNVGKEFVATLNRSARKNSP